MMRTSQLALAWLLLMTVSDQAFANDTMWQVHDPAGWKALKHAARNSYGSGQFEEARTLFRSAIAEAKEIDANNFRVAISTVGLAWTYVYDKRYEEVCKLIPSIMPSIAMIPDRNQRLAIHANALHVLGRAHLGLCYWESAGQNLENARKTYPANSDFGFRVEVLLDLARLTRCKLEMYQSLHWFKQALDLTDPKNSPSDIRIHSETLLEMADIWISLGQYKTADRFRSQWIAEQKKVEEMIRRNPSSFGEPEAWRRQRSHAEKHFEANVIFARLAFLRGDLAEARRLLLEVSGCEVYSWKPHTDYQIDFWLLWTRIHAHCGHWDEAWNAFAKLTPPPWQQTYFEVIRLSLEGRRDFEDGHYVEAAAKLEQAIACADQKLPPCHPVSVNARLDLARIHLILDQHDDHRLIALCHQVMDIERKFARPAALPIPTATRPMHSQKMPAHVLPEPTTQLESLPSGVEAPRDGACHPNIGRAMQILGNYQFMSSHYAEATATLEKSHMILCMTLATDHPEAVMANVDLARAQWALAVRTEQRDDIEFAKVKRRLEDAEQCCGRVGDHSEILASIHAIRGWLAISQYCFEIAAQHFAASSHTWECTRARYKYVLHLTKEDALIGSAISVLSLSHGNVHEFKEKMEMAEVFLRERLLLASLPSEYTRRASLLHADGLLQQARRMYIYARDFYLLLGAPDAARTVTERITLIEQQIEEGPMKRRH